MLSKKFRAWLYVSLCILAIFLFVPVARQIQNFLSAHFGRSFLGYLVILLAALALMSAYYLIWFHLKIRAFSNYIWLILTGGLFLYLTIRRWKVPEEAIHFLEYGLLGFLLFRALSFSIKDKSIYFSSLFIGSLVGIGDEFLQWVIPNRYWDFRDIAFNVFGVALTEFAIWRGIKPKIISQRIVLKSLRKAAWLLGVNLLILGLCLSNTPERIARYSQVIVTLRFLQKEELMHDFTRFKHQDPEIGTFYSRLRIKELKETDKNRASEFGSILTEWKDKDYTEFLRVYSHIGHPFLHEMRVHIFRRERMLETAEKATNEKAKKEALFVAYKENLILEKYFGKTLENSVYKLNDEIISRVKSSVDKDAPYRSPVAYVPSFTSERVAWTIIIFYFAGLIFLSIFPFKRRGGEGGDVS